MSAGELRSECWRPKHWRCVGTETVSAGGLCTPPSRGDVCEHRLGCVRWREGDGREMRHRQRMMQLE